MPDYTLWLQARGVGKESPVKDEKWLLDIFELAKTVAAIPAANIDERRTCYREVFLLLDGERRKLSKRAKAINLRLPLKKFHKVEDVLSMRKWVSEQEERYLHAKRIAKGFWLSGLSMPKFERPYQVEQLLELEKLFKRKGGLYREVQALTRQYKALAHPVPKWTRPYVPEEVETAKQELAAIKQLQQRFRVEEPTETVVTADDFQDELPTDVVPKSRSQRTPSLMKTPEDTHEVTQVTTSQLPEELPKEQEGAADLPIEEVSPETSDKSLPLRLGALCLAVLLFPFRYLLSLWWLFLLFGSLGTFVGWSAAAFCFPDLKNDDFGKRLQQTGVIDELYEKIF